MRTRAGLSGVWSTVGCGWMLGVAGLGLAGCSSAAPPDSDAGVTGPDASVGGVTEASAGRLPTPDDTPGPGLVRALEWVSTHEGDRLRIDLPHSANIARPASVGVQTASISRGPSVHTLNGREAANTSPATLPWDVTIGPPLLPGRTLPRRE